MQGEEDLTSVRGGCCCPVQPMSQSPGPTLRVDRGFSQSFWTSPAGLAGWSTRSSFECISQSKLTAWGWLNSFQPLVSRAKASFV